MKRWCVLLMMFGSVAASQAGPTAASLERRCGTVELLPGLANRPRPPAFLDSVVPLTKSTRDAFGGTFQQVLSANFAVKWTDTTLTTAQAQVVADALERAWAKYIDELGHAPCTGCNMYRLNAYISRATDTPDIDFAGGYAWIDDQGYPYFVISRDIFSQPDANAQIAAVAAHEFYHDIQFSTGAFEWETTEYGWFWEATAEWAAQQALPESGEPFVFSGAFALRSELPVYHYGDPFGSDRLAGVHQYGAAIFFRYLTDKLSPSVVVNTWEQASAAAEPLAEISSRLTSSDLETIHTEFAARNAIWDYSYRQFILDSLTLFKTNHPERDEIAARVPATGAAAATALVRSPYGFGYSTIEIARPESGRFDVRVDMTAALPATLHATLVYGTPGAATYTPLAVAGTSATATVELPAGVTTAYLVISTTTSERLTGNAIPVTYQVTPMAPPDMGSGSGSGMPGDEEGGGCCQSGSNPVGPLGLALVVMLIALRRRRDHQ